MLLVKHLFINTREAKNYFLSSKAVNGGEIYVVRVLPSAQGPVGPEAAKLDAGRELRSKLIDRLDRRREVAGSHVTRDERDKVFIPRVVKPERTVDGQPVAEGVGRKAELRPTAACPDRPNAAGHKRAAVSVSELGIQALKDAALKPGQVPAGKCFAGQDQSVMKRQVPVKRDANGIRFVLYARCACKDPRAAVMAGDGDAAGFLGAEDVGIGDRNAALKVRDSRRGTRIRLKEKLAGLIYDGNAKYKQSS